MAELGSDVRSPCTAAPRWAPAAVRNSNGAVAQHLSLVLATGNSGLSTAAVYAEIDRLQAGGSLPRLEDPEPLLTALSSGDPYALSGWAMTWQPRCRLEPEPPPHTSGRDGGGALGGIVSGSGPTCAFLCASAGPPDRGRQRTGGGQRLSDRPGGQWSGAQGAGGTDPGRG